MRAQMARAHHELVPEALLLVRQTPGSMAKTMERFLCTYRAAVPVLNELGMHCVHVWYVSAYLCAGRVCACDCC